MRLVALLLVYAIYQAYGMAGVWTPVLLFYGYAAYYRFKYGVWM